MSGTKFKLSKPIDAHGDAVDTLTLREPTPADARVVKALPYWVDKDENVLLNPTAAAQYIVRCAQIPMSSVDQLALPDFNALCWEIAGFFLRDRSQTSSS